MREALQPGEGESSQAVESQLGLGKPSKTAKSAGKNKRVT